MTGGQGGGRTKTLVEKGVMVFGHQANSYLENSVAQDP